MKAAFNQDALLKAQFQSLSADANVKDLSLEHFTQTFETQFNAFFKDLQPCAEPHAYVPPTQNLVAHPDLSA